MKKKFWNVLAVLSLCMALSCNSLVAAVVLLVVFVISMQLSGNVNWMEEFKTRREAKEYCLNDE